MAVTFLKATSCNRVTYKMGTERKDMSIQDIFQGWHIAQGTSLAVVSRDLPSVRGAPVHEQFKLIWNPIKQHTALEMHQTIQRPFRELTNANRAWADLVLKSNAPPENLWNGQAISFQQHGMQCRSSYTVHKAMIRTKEFADRAMITTECAPRVKNFSAPLKKLLSSSELKETIEVASNVLTSIISHF